VTTTDAAAARRQNVLVALALVIFAGFGLAGCGSSLFETANSSPTENLQAPKAAAEPPIAKVTINSIVGPPDALGKQLHEELSSSLGRQRVAVTATKDEPADYHLRPYVLAAKEKNGTKVSYVIDVSDPTGKRVNRFTGEEMVPGNGSRDPWAAITPQVAQSIAAKATSSLVGWLPSARAGIASSPAATPVAAPAGVGGEKDDAVASTRTPRPAAKSNVAAAPAATPASNQTTGSITKDGSVTAMVVPVTGAPGDGSQSLTAAIQRELQSKGITVASSPGAYRVEGIVTMGEAREGKQPIQIEWMVKDPQGKRLGTVSQKNDIPEGSLDGAWGRTADQAAGAAVQGIAKLLPGGNRAVN
jgi:hypothetical protein